MHLALPSLHNSIGANTATGPTQCCKSLFELAAVNPGRMVAVRVLRTSPTLYLRLETLKVTVGEPQEHCGAYRHNFVPQFACTRKFVINIYKIIKTSEALKGGWHL